MCIFPIVIIVIILSGLLLYFNKVKERANYTASCAPLESSCENLPCCYTGECLEGQNKEKICCPANQQCETLTGKICCPAGSVCLGNKCIQ